MGKKILLNWTRLLLLVMTIGLSGMISQESWGQGAYEPKITSDKDDYLPGEIATISGSGWTQDQTVELHIEEDPYFGDAYFFESIPVDENGNWSVQIEILERHLGVAFTAYAIGHSTGATAYTYFTDGNITFSTTGLPDGISITVNWNHSANSGNPGTVTGSTSFLSPISESIGVNNNRTFNYTFPANVSASGNLYSLISTSPPSGFDPGGGNVSTDVNAVYELTCSPALISTQPSNQSITYGIGANFTVAYTGVGTKILQWQVNTGPGFTNISNGEIYSGVNSETLTVSNPTVAMSGYQYRVIISGDCGAPVTSNSATLTVNKKDITGSFTADNKVYDGNNNATVLTRSLIGLVNGDVVELTGGTATFADANAGNGKTVTLAGATLSGGAAGNYNLTSVNNTTANIDKAPTVTTVTINGGPFTYTGSAIEPATVTVTGAGGLSLTPDASYVNNINAGTATASYSYEESANHLASSDSKTFVIGKAESTISVDAAGPFIYNTNPQGPDQVTKTGSTGAVTYSYSGTSNSGVSYGPSATKPTLAGSYQVIATLAADDNYNGAVSAPLEFSIGKAEATVVVNAASKTYGDADPALTGTLSGFLAADNVTANYTRTDGETVAVPPYTISATLSPEAVLSNYDITYNTANFTITPRPIEVTAEDKSKIYGNADPAFTYQITSGSLAFTDSFTGALTRDSGEDVGDYAITQGTLALSGNYSLTFVAGNLEITPLPVTVTADAISKFCGQVNPPLTYTSSPAVGTALPNGALIGFTGSLTRVPGEGVGSYAIQQGSLANSNYVITYVGANFTINGVTIDASASSTPVPMGSAAMLSATVTPNVADVTVTFTVTNEANTVVFTTTASTNSSGVATATTGSLNAIGVLKVTATAGSGCAESVAYIPVFDASGSFVTGGGWIESPAGAMPANPNAVGKANFGFVSRYKKGSTQVDGNTEFQFQAGDLNFKSTMHESGSLVISGSRATYRGTGTVNGASGFRFVVVAIDGQWNGQSNPDRFRIKITTTNGTVIYDNGLGADENGNDATILGNNGTGGGSIVIHEAKAKGNKRVSSELITAAWNTPVDEIKKKVDQMSLIWFESRQLPMTLDVSNYDPLTPGFYELKADLLENEFFALEEPISIQVLVQDKPKALDVLVENSNLASGLKKGDVLGTLTTIDPVDDIHTYSLLGNDQVELMGNQLIWRGDAIPAQLTFTVLSTDRAGQTISREITLSRELKAGEFFLYPNPAQRETNVMVDLDREATVAIRIYDAVGRLVVENEAFREGSFTQTLNLDGLAAGFYTVQVKVGDMVMTKRLIKK